jgi:hypothetical protein
MGVESPDFPALVVERFTITGDLDRFTAAYAAHVAAVPAADLAWVDLSGSLRAPLSYLAVSRWASARAHRAARGTGPYQAVLEHSTVAVDYGASVAASRLPSTVECGSNEVAQV